MKIGDIAKKTGVSKSIIRYYEDKGVLPPAVRTESGYRNYGAAELSRIRFVTGVRRLGCSFGEIRALIEMQQDHCVPEEQVLELVSTKLAEVDDELERLKQVRRELQRLREVGAALAKGEKQAEFG
jgi:DNA-binding transcriptional MerR regulator